MQKENITSAHLALYTDKLAICNNDLTWMSIVQQVFSMSFTSQIWGIGGSSRFLTRVCNLDLDLDMVTGL